MRPIKFAELLAATGLAVEKLKVLRQRDQIALAFGRSGAYQSLGYIELDAVAAVLADRLAQRLDRSLAAEIVRDQWGIWSRIVAVSEAVKKRGTPVLFYVIAYEDQKGNRGHMTTGSMLDPDKEENLRAIAEDIRKRFGVTARDYVAIDMPSLLEDVRRAAKAEGYDFRDDFLPPYGDPKLEEILKPFDVTMPDRAFVVTEKAKEAVAERSRRAGIVGRATIEAGLAAMPRERQQGPRKKLTNI